MAGLISDFVGGVAGGMFSNDFLRDFRHASDVFRTSSYTHSPKFKFLFHVYFDVNPEAYNVNVNSGGNFGLEVKTAKLPSYSITTAEMNQYNRKRIVQTKIKYDPIEITFHDDQGNMIRDLWRAYFQYHYADPTKPGVMLGGQPVNPTARPYAFNKRTLYDKAIPGDEDWGLIGEPSVAGLKKVPFFKSINIFSFHQHKFDAYMLINPLITRFGHDTLSYAEGNGVLENTMTVDYETVAYASGNMDGQSPGSIVTGFAMQGSYDKTMSPITRPGSQQNIFGQGGLSTGITNTLGALGQGNLLGAVVNAGTTYNTFKNTNLSQLAKNEILSAGLNLANDTPNRNNPFNFPTGTQAATALTKMLTVPPIIK